MHDRSRYCTNVHELLPSHRRAEIAGRLEAGSPVAAARLATEFGVSEDAIRRDLRALAGEGRCRRTYGGALPLSPASGPMTERAEAAPARKLALGLAAARLVAPGQTIFLDSGSTNLALAAALPNSAGLTVVTNSPPIAAELMRRPKLTAIMIGGAIDHEVGGCIDARAMAEVRHLDLDWCFLGACALSRENGVAAFHYPDAAFKRELLPRSRTVGTLLTTEKLGTRAPHGVASLESIHHLILEHDAPAAMRAMLAGAGPNVLMADRPN